MGKAVDEEGEELEHVGWYCDRGDTHLCAWACNGGNLPLYAPKEYADEVRELFLRDFDR